jgi:AGZA family xanthine/uracil permease-like MFS transporter
MLESLFQLGELNSITMTFGAGLFIAAVLVVRKVPGALNLSVIMTTLLALPVGLWYGDASAINFGNPQLVIAHKLFSTHDFSYVFNWICSAALHG